jgi:2-polyprenyl-6-methoxyphenol hydroxylase-like FAD-dependent oxidoreductase
LRGVQVLRKRFPGLEEELLALGAPPLNWLKETAALAGGSWLPRFDSNLLGFSVSRNLLESQVRERLRRRGNIRFRTGHRVVGLTASYAQAPESGRRESKVGANGTRVTGAVCTVDNETVTMHADLVVDASGRSSRLPSWLEDLGYAAPQESTVNADVGYATRWYRVPENWQADWKMVLLATRFPDIKGGAVVQPVEGKRWVVTLVGYSGYHPPTDEAGFEEFARGLIGPQVWEAISAAEPLTDIGGYQRTENHWRHYERLKRWPQGLIALGDSVCAFNPVYAQGMTVSALSAELLDNFLKGSRTQPKRGLEDAPLAPPSLAFQKKLAKMLQTPWQLATSDDFRWAGRKAGDATLIERFMHRYIEHVLDRIHRPEVCLTFFNVAHLISPPASLFRPRIALPILWEMARNGSLQPVAKTADGQEPEATSL